MAKKVIQKPNAKLLAMVTSLCQLLQQSEPDPQLAIRRFSNLANRMGSREAASQLLAGIDAPAWTRLDQILHPSRQTQPAPK